jgi:acetyl-CoA carboxylase biotin carboxyl carrier protein
MKLKTGKKRIKELKEVIKDTDIEQVCYERDGFNIGIRVAPEIIEEKKSKDSDADKNKVKVNETTTTMVTSNTVGLFYSFIPPSRKILGKKGQKVSKGQRIGVIESMNILKDVKAPKAGKIAERYVKNGDPVEYAQNLFLIEDV